MDTTFNYTYSAENDAEIESIISKYTPATPNEDKMAKIRKLDRQVTKKGEIMSILIGIAGTLVMGTGMSACFAWGGTMFVPGIIIGIIGIVILSSAYPLYRRIVKTEKDRLGPEILRLAEEIRNR